MKFIRYLTVLSIIFPFWGVEPVSAQVAPGDSSAIPVEFIFHHQLAPEDSGVGINGNINGWGDVFKLKEVEPNIWKRFLDIRPGAYEYKFVTYVDTIGQSGVTGWFTDPLNPKFGGPFNNSFITIVDPMIYYFLPRNGAIIGETQPQISASIAVANSSQLDVERIEFIVDGIPVPDANQFYNSETRTFVYSPPDELNFSGHKLELKVFNTAGDSAIAETNFSITNEIVTSPFTFLFDSKSPNFNFIGEVTSVDVKGGFNFEGLDAMRDDDGDGIYKVTKNITVNRTSEYTVIINGGSFINDPDNPNLSLNHRTQFIKRPDPRARFSQFFPASGVIFNSNDANFMLTAQISPSDSGWAIDESSLAVTLDGASVPVAATAFGLGFDLNVDISNPTEGRHVLEFTGSDVRNVPAWPAKIVFGVYPSNSGFHYVDGEDDDKGGGEYKYPSGVPAGSADIREVHITASPNLDSLKFKIKMEQISKFTRLGFQINNKLDGSFVEAQNDIELKIPAWNGQGGLVVIASPNSEFLTAEDENMFYLGGSSEAIGVTVNADAEQTGEFRFSIPLAALEEVMGTFNETWHFGAFAYLKNQNGTVEVGAREGGDNFKEDTDVYDIAFVSDQVIQERLLGNHIVSFKTGGPRLATIGGNDRGFTGIHPTEIDAQLGQAPKIKLFASGGDVFQSAVSVAGVVENSPGAVVVLEVNGNELEGPALLTDVQGRFLVSFNLTEGENQIIARSPIGGNQTSRSQPIIYNYIVDHKPEVEILTTVTQGVVTMDASTSIDPDGGSLNFNWTADAQNPEPVSLSSQTGTQVTLQAPQTPGEYYFTVTATDDAQSTGWARTVVIVDESGAFAPDFTTWHPAWVDSAVVYEVFVRTFSPVGKFTALTGRMSELADLGVNCIWLMPIHPSTGNLGPDNPGYATTDYLDVLEQYGTKASFKAMVDAAHEYGIRVVLDHVIQHTSALHPFLLDANLHKENSPYYPFYMWDESKNFQFLFTWVDLPSINFEVESTRNYLLRVAKYWVQEFDIDGYRCDVAWAINDLRASGPAYWQQWRNELKAMKPDILLLAEANAQENLNYYDGKFDSAYDWAWFGSVRNLLTGAGTIDDMDAAINFYETAPFPEQALPFRFLENHDEQRFFEAFGLAKTKISAAMLLTLPGLPMLYAGQEVGEETFRGVIRWSDTNDLRPYYQSLIRIRKQNTAFTLGDFQRIPNTEINTVYSYLRTHENSNAIVNLNFSGSPVTTNISVPLNELAFDSTATFYLNDVLNLQAYQVTGVDLKNYEIELPAYGAQILILSDSPITSIKSRSGVVPLKFELIQNYPNPFNPTTTINYIVGGDSPVHTKLRIFNILGQTVATLVDEKKVPGRYQILWNGRDDGHRQISSGLYIYQFQAGDFTVAKKMLLLK